MRFTELPFFQHVKWQPDRAELRSFALAMLIGFGVLGLLPVWRAGAVGTNSIALWSVGVGLALGGLIPGLGRFVYLLVYIPTSIIGYVISNVLLTVIFYAVFTPMGLLLKLLGYDLLQLKSVRGHSNWRRVGDAKDSDRYYQQF